TNSITQGEQVADVWQPIYERFGIHIDFAWHTFKWLSESEDMAAVHCVIIGFSHAPNPKPPFFLDGDIEHKTITVADNINPYLADDDIIFVEARTKPLCDVPKMITGNRPADGGALIIEADEYDEFVRREPRALKYIRRLIGAEEFINGADRWCLWLVDATVDDLQLPLIAERIGRCRRERLKGAADRQKLAATPHLFREQVNPPRAIVIPNITSERRQYIPMDYIDDSVICSNRLMLLPDAGLYEFGVLMSSVHMAWTRRTCGRLEMRYSYLKNITYNNFVWASPTVAQRHEIEQSAQAILDARALYPSWTLAALYDPNEMPVELRAAHEHNDRLVEALYGFEGLTEEEMSARLMRLYLEQKKNAPSEAPTESLISSWESRGVRVTITKNINPYLADDDIIFVDARAKPLCDVPEMNVGSMPVDGGNLIVKADELDQFIQREPSARKFIRRLIGGDEFINGKDRYCLWLIDATADDLRLPLIAERIERCRQFRLKSPKKMTRERAATPHLFSEIRQPSTNFIAVPRISSERRKYIPMGFMEPTTIVTDLLQIIPNAGLYEFGVLMSSVHMAWMRRTAGRLKSDYRYSAKIVYNNFIWEVPTASQRHEIEQSAQAILDARALYPSWTLAALYDPNSMPDQLRRAHAWNDYLVEELYGFDELTEDQMVARLMRLYLDQKDHASPPPHQPAGRVADRQLGEPQRARDDRAQHQSVPGR
ncbi:MAG: hypothetical protein IJU71_07020, partial [Selenomonadaceae bacterium]|nr:hypothetical protein [Selenomonadaceae bacterium]